MIDSNKTVIYSLSANKDLANDVAKILGVDVSPCNVSHFADGEVLCEPINSVRDKDVYVIQSTCNPVTSNLMEILVFVDALKRASAGRINVVIPYYGYARQDRKARARDPITAKLVANLIEKAGADRVLTMDLHSSQVQGFFDIPVDNLMGMPVLAKYFTRQGFNGENTVVVSPDVGSVARSRKMASKFDATLAIVDKRRPRANVMEVMNIIGDAKGKRALMLDDMIDTAGTITQGAKAISEIGGACEVYACCSHGVLSGPAIERIEKSVLKEVVVLDTIELPQEKLIDKIKVVTVADMFAEAIERVYSDLPVSKLYE